jgi:uroporphyrinogen decarboxylase
VIDLPPLLRVLAGEALSPPPIWIMRQAGRYLPEYRETRERAGSFLDLCFTPALAAEVTLQPMRRFDLDAAILFSDILVIPHALGQNVSFVEGQGPVLEPLCEERLDPAARTISGQLEPVIETVRLARRNLSRDKALIGFCGAPWTVASYMIAGCGTVDQLPARRLALEEPQRMQALIGMLAEVTAAYLVAQLEAGADVVMLFDSWAGVLDDAGFAAWAIAPAKAIVGRVRNAVPGARIIAFPRGAGARIGDYARETGADAVAVDWMLPLSLARELVPAPMALQGNLDPLRLRVGGRALDEGVDAVLSAMRGRAHIFNLGHGIAPDTPIDNVSRMVRRVRGETIAA